MWPFWNFTDNVINKTHYCHKCEISLFFKLLHIQEIKGPSKVPDGKNKSWFQWILIFDNVINPILLTHKMFVRLLYNIVRGGVGSFIFPFISDTDTTQKMHKEQNSWQKFFWHFQTQLASFSWELVIYFWTKAANI